jgi:hypothetical protein
MAKMTPAEKAAKRALKKRIKKSFGPRSGKTEQDRSAKGARPKK